MSNTLIFVSGVSGAGKTTLIAAALQEIPTLQYLQTVTTRPPRPGEENSFEYVFVDDGEYDRMHANTVHWDHTEYRGYKYGADVSAVRAILASGCPVICSIAPDPAVIQDMTQMYGVQPVTVWIDTPLSKARARVSDDPVRSGPGEQDEAKKAFDVVFQPTGNLDEDKQRFVNLVRNL